MARMRVIFFAAVRLFSRIHGTNTTHLHFALFFVLTAMASFQEF